MTVSRPKPADRRPLATATGIRPLLGVACCSREVAGQPAQAVMDRYVTAALRYADAAGVLIPALPELMAARDVAPRLDGLLLTGSPSNVHPEWYGQAGAEDAEGPYDPARDAMTAALVEAMLELGKPVFGICRGLQELNVALGGGLRRDAGRNPDLIAHHAPAGADLETMFAHQHAVSLSPGGVLEAALGRTALTVNSVHFQAIDRLAPDLRVEAIASDGVIEAVSAEINGASVLAVQWHPEWRPETNLDSQAFFRLLGRAARGESLASSGRRSRA